MQVLGISGSLRQASINSALLRAAQQLAPPGMTLVVFGGVGELPLFNPDLEAQLPAPVLALHAAVAAADAIIVASPEYAHGVTGAVKNALDWLVSFEPFIGKHVAVLNAAPRAQHADMALRETLKVMSANIVDEASITIALLGSSPGDAGMVADAQVSQAIRQSLLALQVACAGQDRVARFADQGSSLA